MGRNMIAQAMDRAHGVGFSVACAAGLALAAVPVGAQQAGDRYWLRAGAYITNVDSSLRIGAGNGAIGTDVDFESDLDLDERRVLPSFFAGADLGDGWQLTGDIYTLSRRGPAPSTARSSSTMWSIRPVRPSRRASDPPPIASLAATASSGARTTRSARHSECI